MNGLLLLATLFACAAVTTARRPIVSGFMLWTATSIVVAVAVATP